MGCALHLTHRVGAPMWCRCPTLASSGAQLGDARAMGCPISPHQFPPQRGAPNVSRPCTKRPCAMGGRPVWCVGHLVPTLGASASVWGCLMPALGAHRVWGASALAPHTGVGSPSVGCLAPHTRASHHPPHLVWVPKLLGRLR